MIHLATFTASPAWFRGFRKRINIDEANFQEGKERDADDESPWSKQNRIDENLTGVTQHAPVEKRSALIVANRRQTTNDFIDYW